MNLRKLDLNLLLVFDTVFRERSVTRAAAALDLTQSAISQALGRLRAFTGDDLFVRSPDGMEPTAFSMRLAISVRLALDTLQSGFDAAGDFDPSTAAQACVIAIDNRAAVILGAALAAEVMPKAPGIRLDLRPSRMIDLATWLDRAELDLAIGNRIPKGERFASLPLFEDRFVALARVGHPLLAADPLRVDDLIAYPHLALTSTGEDHRFLEDLLLQNGLRREVVLRVPLLSASEILLQSDLVAIMSERLARAVAPRMSLAFRALPFPSPVAEIKMVWHRRNDKAAAHRWMRDRVLAAVARTL